MNILTASRRRFLCLSGVASASALLPVARATAAPASAALAEEAFIWGVPLVLTGRYLDLAVKTGVPFNQFVLSPDLATPKTRAVGPNVDTLYGFAWLDLVPGPQVITVPDTQDRYYSIQLLDAYADSFAYIGRRTTGTKAGAFAITPPGFQGKILAGVAAIAAPTGKTLCPPGTSEVDVGVRAEVAVVVAGHEARNARYRAKVGNSISACQHAAALSSWLGGEASTDSGTVFLAQRPSRRQNSSGASVVARSARSFHAADHDGCGIGGNAFLGAAVTSMMRLFRFIFHSPFWNTNPAWSPSIRAL